ncbi:MAG: ribonuclease D [Micrococcales bacterium]|nr:ribonuclease D [Micrococcales bacterium]
MTAEQAPHEPVKVIDSHDEFLVAVDRISEGSGPIAIDAERASGFRYSQRAYLIQVFRRDAGSFLFDPPAIGEFSELQSAIGDLEWVFHAASQDLACLREVGLSPDHIFDTELGARLAGLPRVGLGTVVEELLGVHLAKAHSAADWSTRPLPQPWLVYAALDVELLVDLRDAIAGLLDEAGKIDIAHQEFEATLAKEPKPPNPDAWRRLSGLHSLKQPRNLAAARELWLARDEYARDIDIAPGRLLPDASITAAAKALPATRDELAKLREFNGRASRSQLSRWWAALEAGMTTDDLPRVRVPSDSIPPARAWADRKPEADRRLKAARASFADLSETLAIPVENLLTPELLRQIAWDPPDPLTLDSVEARLAAGGARPWQRDATAQLIVDAFVEASQPETHGDESAS